MKIAGHEVKNVTRETAEIGCTKVTKAEVEAVLQMMKDTPEPVDFKIEVMPTMNPGEFLNFSVRHQHTGWVSVGEKQEGSGNGYGNRSAFFCLEKPRAEKLLRFLAEQLKFKVTDEKLWIIEYTSDHGKRWTRSGNSATCGEYCREEAERLAKKEEDRMGGGWEYRAVPKPE